MTTLEKRSPIAFITLIASVLACLPSAAQTWGGWIDRSAELQYALDNQLLEMCAPALDHGTSVKIELPIINWPE